MTLRVVSYGGGVNSTALLVGLLEHGERPDAILFADTGNEFPETYAHIWVMGQWTKRELGVPITVVKRRYWRHRTLEHECYNLRTLPSKAFGFSGCSVKWKRQVMDSHVKRFWALGKAAVARGEKIERCIGIDAGEAHRGKLGDVPYFVWRYPLIEWDWDRDACLAAIERAGLSRPRKSACFFCPATTKVEVRRLARERPGLFARAVAIEDQARAAGQLRNVKGLGRHWSWREIAEADEATVAALPETPVEYCVDCIDGMNEGVL